MTISIMRSRSNYIHQRGTDRLWAVERGRGAGEVVALLAIWSSSALAAAVFCCWDTHTGNFAGKRTLELFVNLLFFSKVGIEKASKSKI